MRQVCGRGVQGAAAYRGRLAIALEASLEHRKMATYGEGESPLRQLWTNNKLYSNSPACTGERDDCEEIIGAEEDRSGRLQPLTTVLFAS